MFHTGGAFAPGDLFADRAATEKRIMEAYAMPPEMLDPKRGRISIVIGMPQKSRKRPITDDMVQMCADLGIEPRLTFSDAVARVSKAVDQMLNRELVKFFRSQGYGRGPR